MAPLHFYEIGEQILINLTPHSVLREINPRKRPFLAFVLTDHGYYVQVENGRFFNLMPDGSIGIDEQDKFDFCMMLARFTDEANQSGVYLKDPEK